MSVLVERKIVNRAIGKSNLPDIDYTVNPYLGCAHGCVYCYARLYCERRIAENWGKIVVVKENLVRVLKKEIREKKKGIVALSTATDAYQEIEEKEKLTREVLKVLLAHGFHVSIQTKSPLVVRDLDVMLENSQMVDVGVTITTLDSDFAKLIEPSAPLPKERVKAIEKIASEGIKTWIFLGPVIPNEEVEEIIEVAEITKSTLLYDRYRVKPFMKSGIAKKLADKAMKTNWKEVFEKIRELCERKGVIARPAFD